ncbi:MAG TPA: hypothetical protein VNZ03_35920 [Terriglobales bacterium]|jgi:hypothetical protein|nr:hypothetical protein [Terriglobales bacterium]
MRSIRSIIGELSFELPGVAARYHSAVSTYPGGWMDDVVREILKKELVWKDGQNIVDVWIEAVSERGHNGQRTLAQIYELEDVDVGKALSVLRAWVSKTIEAELLVAFRTGFLSVSAGTELEEIWLPTSTANRSTAWIETRTSLVEEPGLTLADLTHRNRHREVIWELYPRLVEEVDGVLNAARLRTSSEDILKRFPLLRELTNKEFADLLANKNNWTASAWATTIIQNRTGKSTNTIQKYGQPSGYRNRNLRAAA